MLHLLVLFPIGFTESFLDSMPGQPSIIKKSIQTLHKLALLEKTPWSGKRVRLHNSLIQHTRSLLSPKLNKEIMLDLLRVTFTKIIKLACKADFASTTAIS